MEYLIEKFHQDQAEHILGGTVRSGTGPLFITVFLKVPFSPIRQESGLEKLGFDVKYRHVNTCNKKIKKVLTNCYIYSITYIRKRT